MWKAETLILMWLALAFCLGAEGPFERGKACFEKGDWDQAIQEFTRAIELQPQDVAAYSSRGSAYARKAEWDHAHVDLAKAVEMAPDAAVSLDGLAWLLATCPENRLRDGLKARVYAKKACELTDWQNAAFLDTLAAACAEAGQFEEAVEWQGKALLDPSCPRKAWDEGRARLKLYEEGKPYRQPGPTPPALVPAAGPADKPAGMAPAHTLGLVGMPDAIECQGNRSFSTAALRVGLAGHAPFLAAAHPSAPLDAYLDVIRRALVRGYRAEGFPDVVVQVSHDAIRQKVFVTIEEGQRFTHGPVRVEGVEPTLAADIVRVLTLGEAVPGDPLAAAARTRVMSRRAAVARREVAAKARQAGAAGATAPAAPGPADEAASRAPAVAFLENASALGQRQSAPQPLWGKDKAASFAAGAIAELTGTVQGVLAEKGFVLAAVSLAIQPDTATGQVALVVRIEPGPQAIIGQIRITGNQRDPDAEILKLTGLRSGAELRPDTVTAAWVALWKSARFLAFDITAKQGTPQAREVDLTVELVEADEMPPITEPLSPAAAALARLANWLTTEGPQRELVLRGGTEGENRFELVASCGKGLAFLWTRRSAAAGDGGDGLVGLVTGADDGVLVVRSGGAATAHRVGGVAGQLTLGLEMVPEDLPSDPKKPHGLSFGAGVTTGNGDEPRAAGLDLSIVAAPASLAHASEGQAMLPVADGMACCDYPWGKTWFREATGELQKIIVEVPAEWATENGGAERSIPLVLELGLGEYDRVRQLVEAEAARLAPAQRDLPLIDVLDSPALLPELAAAVARFTGERSTVAEFCPKVRSVVSLAALVAHLPAMRTWLARANGEATDFTIPREPGDASFGNPLVAQLGARLYWMALAFLPADAWPAKLTRELFYVAAGNPRNTGAVLEELYRDPQMGPLGSIITAQLLLRFHPPQAWRFARRAQVHASVDDFRNDWMMLFRSQTPLSEAAQDLVRSLVRLDAAGLDALLGGLPDAAAVVVRHIVDGLRAAPDQAVAEVIRPYLDALWATQLRPELADHVESWLLPGRQPADAAIVAATVNGEPVSRKMVAVLSQPGGAGIPAPALMGPATWGADTPEAQALAALIAQELVLQDTRGKGMTPDPTFASGQIKAIVDARWGGDEAALRSALAQVKMTVDDLSQALTAAAVYQSAVEAITAKTVSAAAVDVTAEGRREAALADYLTGLRAQAVVSIISDPAGTAAQPPAPPHATRVEAETAPATAAEALTLSTLTMERWGIERWSGGRTAVVRGSDGAGWAEWRFEVPAEGCYRFELLALRGVNCPRVQVAIDGAALGEPVELFAPVLQPSGSRVLGTLHLTRGQHYLRCTVSGRHPSALGHEFCIDAFDLVPVATEAADTDP